MYRCFIVVFYSVKLVKLSTPGFLSYSSFLYFVDRCHVKTYKLNTIKKGIVCKRSP